MPIVEREVEHDVASMHTVVKARVRQYIHPTRVSATDTVVPPEQMAACQIADLAYLYPEEYGPIAERRGIAPAVPPPPEADTSAMVVDESTPLVREPAPSPGITPDAIRTYGSLTAPEAVAFIEDGDTSPEWVAALYEIEQVGKGRATVLRAMEARLGMGAPPKEAEDA